MHINNCPTKLERATSSLVRRRRLSPLGEEARVYRYVCFRGSREEGGGVPVYSLAALVA